MIALRRAGVAVALTVALVGGVASPAAAHGRPPEVTKYIQKTLENVYGIEVGRIDGIYGPRTRRGVLILQQKYDLRWKDGIAGPETFDCLQWCRFGVR